MDHSYVEKIILVMTILHIHQVGGVNTNKNQKHTPDISTMRMPQQFCSASFPAMT